MSATPSPPIPPHSFSTKLVDVPDVIIDSFVPRPSSNRYLPQKLRDYYIAREKQRQTILDNHTAAPTSILLDDLDLQGNEWILTDSTTYRRQALLKKPITLIVAGFELKYEIGDYVSLEFQEGSAAAEAGTAYIPEPKTQVTQVGGTRRRRKNKQRSRRNKRRV